MAFKTAGQADAIRALTLSYGTPDRVQIEDTNEPYGVVWLRWWETSNYNPERNLFIHPDGSRLAWRQEVS